MPLHALDEACGFIVGWEQVGISGIEMARVVCYLGVIKKKRWGSWYHFNIASIYDITTFVP